MSFRFSLCVSFPLFLLGSFTAAHALTPTLASPPPGLTTPEGKVPPPPGQIDLSNEPIVKVVANVQPAVVNITAEETVPEYYLRYDPFFRPYRVNRTAQSIGSGLLISADGYILTNAHVVALAETEKSVNITLSTGSKYRATIINEDEDKDLALLKIDDKTVQFPYFDLSYVSPNYLGETVVALGSPEGYQNSVSHGILSAKNRTFTAEGHTYNDLIQTDAAINPGNSGGPLVDLNGSLVGINSAKLAGEAIENIGFAIPNEVVVPWANDAIAVAKGLKAPTITAAASALDALHRRLGLTLKPLTADEAAEKGLDFNGGLVITAVEDNSPAADAGLQKNMIVVAIGNRVVTDEKTLPIELQELGTGARVRLHIIYQQQFGAFLFQRGGSVMLTAR
ncbi:MAG TPA: trypsin-like peptidase domain-containing protein [Candidatus Methylacidiphilales bacterium]|nr:trypsin-like peptidase domain-containing protein [Candidatus Methylacidiphilales bacterium]